MKQYKFVNFLSDPEEYGKAEIFWRNLIENILSGNQTANDWEEWFNNTYADGTPVRDGNPIISMVSHKLKLGIRIIQYDPFDSDASGNDFELGAWVDYYGKLDGDKGIRTLVVSSVVTEETEIIASKIIHAFVIEGLSDEGVESFLHSRGTRRKRR